MLYVYTTFVLNNSSLLKRDIIADKPEAAFTKNIVWLYSQRAVVEWKLSHKDLNHSSWQKSQPSVMVREPKKFWDV